MVLICGDTKENGKKPDRYAWLIRRIFDTQKDLNAVMLAAPPYWMGYAISHAPFDPLVIPESYLQLREAPAYPYAMPWESTEEFVQKINLRNPAVIVENNFILTCGSRPIDCLDRMEVGEYTAKAEIDAMPLGGLKPINPQQVQELIEFFNLPR